MEIKITSQLGPERQARADHEYRSLAPAEMNLARAFQMLAFAHATEDPDQEAKMEAVHPAPLYVAQAYSLGGKYNLGNQFVKAKFFDALREAYPEEFTK